MKVLIINGSPRINGNTSLAIKEMEKIFEAQGVETETVQVLTNRFRKRAVEGFFQINAADAFRIFPCVMHPVCQGRHYVKTVKK